MLSLLPIDHVAQGLGTTWISHYQLGYSGKEIFKLRSTNDKLNVPGLASCITEEVVGFFPQRTSIQQLILSSQDHQQDQQLRHEFHPVSSVQSKTTKTNHICCDFTGTIERNFYSPASEIKIHHPALFSFFPFLTEVRRICARGPYFQKSGPKH
jgi:hypothetical protein